MIGVFSLHWLHVFIKLHITYTYTAKCLQLLYLQILHDHQQYCFFMGLKFVLLFEGTLNNILAAITKKISLPVRRSPTFVLQDGADKRFN